MRYALVLLVLVLAGCGGDSHRVPNVAGDRLDVAAERLEDDGLEYELIGGGTFGVVVKANWFVCEQHPAAGSRASSVELVVARSCPAADAPPRPPVVPNFEYEELDDARAEAREAGVEVTVIDDGAGPIVLESNWTVCSQYPSPGERAWTVQLYVEHFCD